jgi:hypothetical protein
MQVLVRSALVLHILAALMSLFAVGKACAQHCHAPLTVDAGDYTYRTYAGFLAASFGDGDDAGNYQGVYAGFVYHHPWWGAELRIPAYRLKRPALSDTYGVGDLLVSVSGTVLRLRRDKIRLGIELPVMLPTGDEDRDLGMGHPMLMPDAWLTLDFEPFVLRAQVGYGRVLGSEPVSHHHEAGEVMRSPLVNPMNRSELEHALIASLGLRRKTSIHVGWLGAVPIDDATGVTRQILTVGAAARLDPVELSFELQRPVAGDPFSLRGVLELTATF